MGRRSDTPEQRLRRQYNKAHPFANNPIQPREEKSHEAQVQEVLDNLLALSAHNAFAGKVWLQAKGEFVEKREDNISLELTAAEHIRIARDAQRRLREGSPDTDGSPEMPDKCRVLHDPVCLDSGQEYGAKS